MSAGWGAETIGDPWERVATTWTAATEQSLNPDDRGRIRRALDPSIWFSAPDDLILESALLARQWRDGRWSLPLTAWQRVIEAMIRIDEADRRPRPPVETSVLRSIEPENEIETQALRLMVARLRHRRVRERVGVLARDKRMPVSEVPGLASLDADVIETAALLLLARTAPDGQFSSTGTGKVFIGHLLGYHAEGERVYVQGLSAALDTTTDVLDGHRAGRQPPGGRFYVYPNGDVECALCRWVFWRVGGVGPHPRHSCVG